MVRRIVFRLVILLLLVSGCGSDSGVGGADRADSSDLGSSSSAPIEEEAGTSAVSIPDNGAEEVDPDSSTKLTLDTELQQEVESPESRLMVDVDDYQRIVVDHRVPGCPRAIYVDPPSADWTFEVGLEDLDSALGIGTWKYSDGQVEVYYPGRVTGQLAGLEFSRLPVDDERNIYNFATARVDDGSLVLVKDIAIEDVGDPDEEPWCPVELRLRGLSPEEEELFLNGLIVGQDM